MAVAVDDMAVALEVDGVSTISLPDLATLCLAGAGLLHGWILFFPEAGCVLVEETNQLFANGLDVGSVRRTL